MGLAEEEVLIRDDSGLLLGDGEPRMPRRQEWYQKLSQTLCLSMAFLVLGLCVAIPGPTLIDLGDQVNATTAQMMIVFVTRSLGYLVGALIGGVLFDSFNKQLLLFCTLLLSSVATIVIPWSLTLIVMATMFAVQGITMGVLDTGGNIFCIQIWGKKNGPYIQILHFAFGIGAFIAPLLAKPFLSPGEGIGVGNTSLVEGNIPVSTHLHSQVTEFLNRSNRVHRSIFDLAAWEEDMSGEFSDKQQIFFSKTRSKRLAIEQRDYFPYLIDNYDIAGNVDSVGYIYRRKRQSESRGGGNDQDSLWKWKKQQAKRDLTSQAGASDPVGSDSSTSQQTGSQSSTTRNSMSNTGESLDESKTNEKSPSEHIMDTPSNEKEDVNHGDNGGITTNINNNPDSESTVAEKDNDDKPKSSGTVQAISLDKKQLPEDTTDGTVVESIEHIENLTVTGDNNNGTNVTGSQPVPTTTTSTTTLLPKPAKPVAASDNNRNKATADGALIQPHLKQATHEDSVPNPTPGPVVKDQAKTTTLNTSTVVNNEAGNINGTNVNQTDAVNTGEDGFDNSTVSDTPSSAHSTSVTTTEDTSHGAIASKKETTVEIKPTTATKLATTTPQPPPTTPQPPPITTPQPPTTPQPITTPQPPTTTSTTITTTPSTTSTTTPRPRPMSPAQPPVIVPDSDHHIERPNTDQDNNPDVPPQGAGSENPDTPNTESSTLSKVNESSISPSSLSPEGTTIVSEKPKTAVDNFIDRVKHMSKIQFAYVIIGAALFLNSIMFLVMYCKNKRSLVTEIEPEGVDRLKGVRICYKGILVLLLGMFFFCYMGLEVSYGALITTFTVEFSDWPKTQGATVAAIFWGSLATGRGLSIFLAVCCGPTFMLIMDSIFMIIGGLILSFGLFYYDKLLWLGTLVLGLGMSSTFPAGISWAEKYFHLSGKSTAVFVIGSALGQMVIPSSIGYFYEYYSPMSLMYACLALTCAATVLFIMMQCFAVCMNRQVSVRDRNGFLPLEDVDDDDGENLEMDLVHFDRSAAKKRHRDTRTRGDAQYHTLISDLDDD